MKTKIIFQLCFVFLLLGMCKKVLPQVTIGAGLEPKIGVLLDLKEDNSIEDNSKRGIGMPRVKLLSETSLEPCVAGADAVLAKAHTGLLVYNTETVGQLVPGIYYWDGTLWKLLTADKNIWNRIGTNLPSTLNAHDSYLQGKAVIGGNALAGDAVLTVNGGNSNINSIIFGKGAGSYSTIAGGGNITAEGVSSVALGRDVAADGSGSLAAGNSAKATGPYSIALGEYSKATHNYSIALGRYASAENDVTVAIGLQSVADTQSAIAIGHLSKGNGIRSVSIGSNSNGVGENSLAFGNQALAEGYLSTAIGDQAQATQYSSIAVGHLAKATGENSLAIGEGPNALATSSLSIGHSSRAEGVNSMAIGLNSQSIGKDAISIGIASNSSGETAISIGTSSKASGAGGIALGVNTQSLEDNSIVIGSGSSANKTASSTFGADAHAEGSHSTALGVFAKALNDHALAVGSGAEAEGEYSIAIGHGTKASSTHHRSTSLGFQVFSQAENSVTIGGTGQAIYLSGNPQVLSDKRVKKKIQYDVPGLEFIRRLTPVTYYFDYDTHATIQKIPEERRDKDFEKKDGEILKTGFLAQDVEAAAKEVGFEFNGVCKTDGEKTVYHLSYELFVVPLVQAVKEQNEIIDAQEIKIKEMERRLADLEKILNTAGK